MCNAVDVMPFAFLYNKGHVNIDENVAVSRTNGAQQSTPFTQTLTHTHTHTHTQYTHYTH